MLDFLPVLKYWCNYKAKCFSEYPHSAQEFTTKLTILCGIEENSVLLVFYFF